MSEPRHKVRVCIHVKPVLLQQVTVLDVHELYVYPMRET